MVKPADEMAADAVIFQFGEVVLCSGSPIDAIVERSVRELDEYNRVIGSFHQISVFHTVAKNWGESPTFSIDAREYRLLDAIDDTTALHRYRLKPL